jgi:glycosyltransferase involved in cell wall biosynthesis
VLLEQILSKANIRTAYARVVSNKGTGGVYGIESANFAEQVKKDWMAIREDIKHIYEQSDIACLPSYREGLPKYLVEAMAIGGPVITTDAIGCRECVDEGINGFKRPAKDRPLLSARIKQVAG